MDIVCRYRKWRDGQFMERSGQITEGWKLARFGRTAEHGFPFQIGCATGAIEARILKDQVTFDGPITIRVVKGCLIKQGTIEVDRLLQILRLPRPQKSNTGKPDSIRQSPSPFWTQRISRLLSRKGFAP